MKGAIVFLIAFFALFAATLAYAELPPGNTISAAINIDPNVEWSGFRVITLTSAIFNGVIYGLIAWIIFTIEEKIRKSRK